MTKAKQERFSTTKVVEKILKQYEKPNTQTWDGDQDSSLSSDEIVAQEVDKIIGLSHKLFPQSELYKMKRQAKEQFQNFKETIQQLNRGKNANSNK